MNTRKAVIAIIVIAVLVLGIVVVKNYEEWALARINTFEKCEAEGFPVAESYPRQCYTPDGRLFIESINNAPDKSDLIRVEAPLPNEVISSPLTIQGVARGFWFFEASFPVELWDSNRNLIPLDPPYIMTTKDWMTEDFVPFSSVHTFKRSSVPTGFLILHKNNPSGMPGEDDMLFVPVRFR